MDNALFFARQASTFVVGLWYITLLLTAVAVWSYIELARARQLSSWSTVVLVGSSLAMFVFLPVFSLTFWGTSGGASTLLGWLDLAYLFLVAAAIARAHGDRRAIAGMAIAMLWLNVGNILVSSMAVSGVWL